MHKLVKVLLTLFALTLAEAATAQTTYTPYAFTNLAGLAGIDGTNDGTGAAARFSSPSGVALDPGGNIYVIDNLLLRRITPAGVVTSLAGGNGQGTNDGTNGVAQFHSPFGLAVDSQTNIYVADTYNSTIRKVSPVGANWVVTTIAGFAGGNGIGNSDGSNSTAHFNYPSGIAVDAQGVLYVADTKNAAIRRITLVGEDWVVQTIAGGHDGSQDGTNNLARFSYPEGIAVDSTGTLFVSDSVNSTIRKIIHSGTNWITTTIAGLAGDFEAIDGTNSVARFNDPAGLTVDRSGNIFVADEYNQTVRKITPSGTNWVVTTLGGVPNITGSGNTAGGIARFNYPTGVALDGFGNLFVADDGNFLVRVGVPPLTVPVIVVNSVSYGSGQFGFNLLGPSGQPAVVEISTDLTNWTAVWTNTFGTGTLPYSDATVGGTAQRFYRARTP